MRLVIAASVVSIMLIACASEAENPAPAGRSDSALEAAKVACTGKSAGDTCRLCPPSDSSCVETMELKVCSAAGVCGASTGNSNPQPPPAAQPTYAPCAGKAAGASCSLCDPADADCVETLEVKTCDASGECKSDTGAQPPPPAYAPCAGKKPGASCTLCDPADTGCIETAVLKTCDASGTCG
jgi:hypothetical protein